MVPLIAHASVQADVCTGFLDPLDAVTIDNPAPIIFFLKCLATM